MKRVLATAVAMVVSCSMSYAETPNAVSKKLVRIDKLTRDEVKAYGVKGFDVAKAGKDFVEMVVSPTEERQIRRRSGSVSVLIPNLDDYVTKVLKGQKKGEAYYTYDTLTDTMKKWAEKYKDIAVLSSIGKSCEGRDIWAMKVSDNPLKNEAEPAILIMGAHHAREWISVEVPMETLKQVLEGYGKDQSITKSVNEREIWIVPMVNPDGVTYSQTKSKFWRKNRRDNNGRDFGVDLNRNYGYQWGDVGASNSPGQDTYHGKKAFSEPETSAIKALAEREKFQASISFHSYSELVLFPFGYAYNVPNDDTPILSKFAQEMAQFNKYTPENSAELYPCMGDSDDYMYGANKALAFTFELAQEFIPPAAQIATINKLNVPAMLYAIDKCGAYAVTNPAGDASLIQTADVQTSIDALSIGNSLLKKASPEYRTAMNDRINVVGQHLAELVISDLKAGKTESFKALEKTETAGFVMNRVKQVVVFDQVHDKTIAPDMLKMVVGK